MRHPAGNRSLLGAALAAIGASLCCVGPFVLLMLGVGGAWISTLTALEPLRPVFIGLVVVLLGLAFRKLYLVPETCASDQACADPTVRRRQRAVFWTISGLLLALIAFPWYAPALLS